MAAKQMTTREAIVSVLSKSDAPMPTSEVIEKTLKAATGLKGATPKQTVYSVLYSEARKPTGIVRKTGKGKATKFKLNPKAAE
jgi:Fe2+ or Zn2+ uptake regulation protein